MEKPSLAAYRSEVTVKRMEIFPVRYPTVMPFHFCQSPVSGVGRPAVFIKLTASDGTVGWGQSVPSPRWGGEPLESACFTLELYFKPVVLGKNPFDIEYIHRAMDAEAPDAAHTALAITKAGVDLALHDLAGRIAGKNVAELWDRPKGRSVELSWTVSPADPDNADNWVALGREEGYRHFNIKVAPYLDKDRRLCRFVRELAPEGFLWADANCGYDEATALRAVTELADDGAAVLEQPLRPHCITGYQRVRKAARLPIVMDEGLISPEQLREYLVLGCCDGAAMKPARCGGLLSARQQVELLREGGHMFLGSGLTDPDVSLAASLILYGAYGLDRPAALNGPQFLGMSMLKTPLVPLDGFLTAPDGPGLGVEIDEDAVREHCCFPHWK